MSVVVVTPPQPLVSLELAKQHLRVTTPDEDDLINLYITAAQSAIDGPGGWLNRAIGVQELEYRFDGFIEPIWSWGWSGSSLFWGSTPDYATASGGWPCGRIDLPYPPMISVDSVVYQDLNGVDQTLPSAAYLATDDGLDASFGTSFPTGRWQANAVRVRYSAGYVTVPPAIVAALLLMVGDLYGNRESVETGVRAAAVQVPMSTTVEALLGPYRVFA